MHHQFALMHLRRISVQKTPSLKPQLVMLHQSKMMLIMVAKMCSASVQQSLLMWLRVGLPTQLSRAIRVLLH
eukprot:3601575-Karenia_brevis.AAC.1